MFSNCTYQIIWGSKDRELLKPLIDKLFVVLHEKYSIKEDNDAVYLDAKNEGECKLVKGCKYEHGENGICKKLITRNNIEVLTGYLIPKLLYFPLLREKNPWGEFKIKKDINILDIQDLIIRC